MARMLRRLFSAIRLARVSTSFAAIADVWFVILWTRARPNDEPGTPDLAAAPLWLALLGGAAAAVGLYAFGTALNDLVDRGRDQALGRDRPLAVGGVRPEQAAFGVVLALVVAVLGATAFGTTAVQLTVLLAGAILAFNAAGKFLPAIGFLLLALVYAGHMLVPNFKLQFLWPVWLVMTHALAVAGLTHWVGRKSPPISKRAIAFAVMGWLGASAILLAIGLRRFGRGGGEEQGTDGTTLLAGLWPDWVPLAAVIGPALLAAVYGVAAYRRVRSMGFGPRTAEKLNRYGALWMSLYGAAWLLGAGHLAEGGVLVGLAAFGLIGMSVLREVSGMIEYPLAYRR